MPLGQVGAIDAGYVALVTQKGLEVVDPLKGTLLWKKMDVTTHTRVFGDENHLFLIENADAESAGTGRVLSARDGSSIDAAPDFGGLYANKIRVEGRTMLVAVPQKGGLILKRYDIPTGKDLWSKNFGVKTYPLHTYQAGITGAVDVDGNAYILNAETGEELVKTNVIKSQILADDLRGLERPILLADADRYYIALNRPVDGNKISGSVIGNNFNNGMSCAQVNGWVLALKRGEGEEKIGGAVRKRTNGDFLWHTFKPLANQMVLVEQFEEMPVLIFTSRYNEMLNMGVGGNRWLSPTQSVDKRTGKMIWDPGPRPSNGSPQYLTFTFDPSSGTITMATLGSTLVHYIDDGRKIVVPGGDATASGPGASGTGVGPMLPPPGFVPMGPGAVIRPPVIRMPPIRRPLPVAPLPDLPKK
ncbi:MAG: PQQ-binding-like beta-propeller repeat protein [Gemmataceae bacterium]